MNDVRFVASGPGRGELFINGHRVPGVIRIEPDLFDMDQVAQVTVTLAVERFTFEPKAAE